MGLLVGGIWQDRWYDTKSTGGRFVRTSAGFRNWITADGSSGPTGEGGFADEGGRYHLYVSLACPWAHRALIMRRLKGLEAMIGISAVHWRMLDHGWTFEDGSGVVPDPIHGARYLHQVYTAAKPDYSGRVTVPALWDKTKNTIVSNESAEIIRMMNSGFRRNRRQGRRLLSRGSSARDRHAQHAHLRSYQQRRIQGRIRDDAAGL